MWTFLLWNIAALAAAIYCIAKAVIDLRARRYGWGIVGLLSAAVFLLTGGKRPVADDPRAWE